LKIRIVWPALFPIAGTIMFVGYAIAVLGFFSLARPVYDQPLSFSETLSYLSIGLSGLVGLGFSLALLFDEARHRLWGILVLVSCGAASYYYLTQLFLPALIRLDATIPLPGWFGPLAYALFLSLVGAIGGILWKPKEPRTEPRASSNQNLKD
jgi:hypothetical protein